MHGEWVISTVIEGKRVYWIGIRSNGGKLEASWTTDRDEATMLQVSQSMSEDTAKALGSMSTRAEAPVTVEPWLPF